MKKGKVFGKNHIAAAVMLLALGGAVWLNMKYTPSSGKYLGEASYVSASSSEPEAVETAARAETEESDYFTEVKAEREKNRREQTEEIEETLKSAKLTDDDKKSALAALEKLADRGEQESNIEALLRAKGFEKAVAIIGDAGISVVVKTDGLTSAQTLQIQDTVTAETGISLSDIKIIPIK